jgi:hypothetical protein
MLLEGCDDVSLTIFAHLFFACFCFGRLFHAYVYTTIASCLSSGTRNRFISFGLQN